jgi:UDP-N-acetyl-D-glucosamine dehydrogenase
MPNYVLDLVSDALNDHSKPLRGSRVLVLGVSYKPDVGDVRESPALKLIELLGGLGADISYHDAFVPDLLEQGLDLRSVELADGVVEAADIVCVVTAHSGIDYADLAGRAQLVFDFRNAVPRDGGKVHVL